MKFLVIKLSAIGDVVLSLGFLEALRTAYPDAHITWVVEEAASDIVLDHPALDRVIVSRRKSWGRNIKRGRMSAALGDLSAFLHELRFEKYDVVVDLQGLFKSGILAFLSRGRRKIGFHGTRELSWIFLNERLPAYNPERHAAMRYLDVAEYLGANVKKPRVFFPVHEKAAEEARHLLVEAGKPLVAVNPGAKWPTKLWPERYWAELCRILTDDLGISVVLTGSPDEAPVNKRIADSAPGIIDLTGKTKLKVLAEIFRQCDLVISPDTGPMHLAAAVETPVMALFGPTAPWRTGPFGPGHMVLRTGDKCSPCFKKSCPDVKCMNDLKPKVVAEIVNGKLGVRDV
jgi:heptosyltransferase-1